MDDLLLQCDARRNGDGGSAGLRRQHHEPADNSPCIAATSKAAAEIELVPVGSLDAQLLRTSRWERLEANFALEGNLAGMPAIFDPAQVIGLASQLAAHLPLDFSCGVLGLGGA